jgi:hypothetical protein
MLPSSFEGKAKEGLDNGRIAVACRKNLPKVGFHPLDKFERRASSQGSNDGNLFSLVILSQTLKVDAHVLWIWQKRKPAKSRSSALVADLASAKIGPLL